MERITRWGPDTCGCILEYEWDDTQDETTRTHTFKRAIQLCDYHKALPANEAYNAVTSENTRKNIAFDIVEKRHSEVTPDNYLWFFDTGRVLQVSLIGIALPAAAKAGLQTAFDTKFGAGKAKVL